MALSRRRSVLYEKTAVLDEPTPTDGNYRIYDETFLKRLIAVRELRDVGFEIAELPELLHFVKDEWPCRCRFKRGTNFRERLRSKMAVLERLELALGG